MAARTNARIDREALDADQAALQRVSNLGDYVPTRAELSIEALRALETAMLEARHAEDRLRHEAEVARDQAIATSKAFHEAMKGMKAQIVAQYGEDSPALHAVGRKRRSERRPPVRRVSAS